MFPDPVYRFIIANPIPFQCSTVYLTTKGLEGWSLRRDKVWSALWELSQVRGHFLARMRSYRPHVIINACTSRLKGKVAEVLQNAEGSTFSVESAYHPSRNWARGIYGIKPQP